MHESTKRLSYPYIIWISIMIIVPMLLIFLYSIIDPSDGNPLAFRFTLDNYIKFFNIIFIYCHKFTSVVIYPVEFIRIFFHEYGGIN